MVGYAKVVEELVVKELVKISVSILIPTRNRAALLPHALASALTQDYENLEVIVSNNASSDATAGWLAGQSDPRLRVVQTDNVLPFHEHWRFLLSHARGDYVVFLCDDDAFVAGAIRRGIGAMADTGLDLVCWRWAFFDNQAKTLRYTLGNQTVDKLPGQATAQALLNGDFGAPKPQLNNCLIPRLEMLEMISNFPFAFSPFGGDFATGIFLLSTRTAYAFVDRPMSIFTEWPGSFSYALEALDHSAVDKYFQKAGGYPPIPVEMPLANLPLLANRLFANTVAAAHASKARASLNWDSSSYFLIAWNEIVKQFDQAENRDYFHAALQKQPVAVRTTVEGRLGTIAGFQKSVRQRGWRDHQVVQTIEWALRPKIRRSRELLSDDIDNVGLAAQRLADVYDLSFGARLPRTVRAA